MAGYFVLIDWILRSVGLKKYGILFSVNNILSTFLFINSRRISTKAATGQKSSKKWMKR